MPKIEKSASCTKEHKLDTLQSSKKISHHVTGSHEDSNSCKSKTSYKVYCWWPPDLSSGVDNLFEAMGLKDNSKLLIISMNL
jgi:hypothetical protein